MRGKLLIYYIKKVSVRLLRAKGDNIIRSRTGASAGSIIVSVTVRCWTRILENLRIMCRRTRLRRCVLTGAAKHRRVKRGARAFTRNHRAAAVSHLQFLRTHGVQVRRAPRVLAVTGSSGSQDADANIVTVHETYVVEVLVAVTGESDGELRQSRWWNASPGAPQSTCAVSGGACSDAGSVEAAAGPGPQPPGPA